MRLIDADEAADKLDEYGLSDFAKLAKYTVSEFIKSRPIVDPVKHGKWKMHNTYYACSLCGYEDMGHMYKYCPDCGAKMDGD